jgi:hypothetical protein
MELAAHPKAMAGASSSAKQMMASGVTFCMEIS